MKHLAVLFLTLIVCSAPRHAQTSAKWADEEVYRCALKSADANQDGVLSEEEAEALTVLNLTVYRIHVFTVKSYEDLQRFPHLKKVWLGDSEQESVDLSRNRELEFVCVQDDRLKTLILPVGCTPQIAYPTHPGEITIKRVVSPDDPNAIWYQ